MTRSTISSIAASKTNKPLAGLTSFCYKCDPKNALRSLTLGSALAVLKCLTPKHIKFETNI